MIRMITLALSIVITLLVGTSVQAGGMDQFTSLMIHSDNDDLDTSFEDSTDWQHPITPYGDVHHSTSEAQFGNSSIYFDGFGDYLSIPDSIAWFFCTGSFTIDFRVMFNDLNSNQVLFYQTTDRLNRASIQWGTAAPFEGLFIIMTGYGNETFIMNTGTSGWSTGTWYHVAIVRTGEIMRIYRDGIEIAYEPLLTAWPDISAAVGVGGVPSGDGTSSFNGYLDEIRFSKDIARWTSDFEPPTEPYQDRCSDIVVETPPEPVCSADYNGDGVVNGADVKAKRRDLHKEFKNWIHECWKPKALRKK